MGFTVSESGVMVVFRRFIYIFLAFGLSFTFNAATSDASDTAESVALMQGCIDGAKSKRFDSTVKETLSLNGWPPTAVELHFKYQSEVILTPPVLRRLCKDLTMAVAQDKALVDQINQETSQNGGLSKISLQIMYQSVTRLFAVGLKRLPSDQLKPYFELTEAMFNQMPRGFCADLWLQNPSPDFNQLMLSTQGLLPIEIQKRYLNLVNNAVFAEVNNWPPVTVVEGAEAAQLNSVFGDHLTDYSSRFTNPYKLALMLNNVEQGTDEEYCDLGRMYYGALKSIPGRDGDRARKLIIDSLM